ncbi:MAG: hypothetical protein LBG57_05975 [Treponema sp.]|jgi:hypothetical protein|nr:hypothetical protein [Treponema sp.]
MADTELIQTLDYILNRSDEASIDVLAEAVVRRRRELFLTGGVFDIPSPRHLAKEISGNINAGIGAGIEGLKKSIRDMAVRIIREEAPELTDAQVEKLCRAWIPENAGAEQGARPPGDMLSAMIDQFVAFSRGTLSEAIDESLREELGAWPKRYWNSFPPVIRLIITDFLKDKISEEEYNSRIGIALGISDRLP